MIVSSKARPGKIHKTAVRVDTLNWHQDCLCVTVLLASSFGVKAMRRLLKRSGYEQESAQESGELLLAALHEACHHDPEVRAMVRKELNAKYKSTVSKCSRLTVGEVERQAVEGSWLIPFMWACFQDDEPMAHRLGRRLAHLAIVQGMQKLKQNRPAESASIRVDQLTRKNHALREKLYEAGRENKQLAIKLSRMPNRSAVTVQHTEADIAALRKKIKRLSGELQEQKEKQKEFVSEIAVWRSLALAGKTKAGQAPQKAQLESNAWCVCCDQPSEGSREGIGSECGAGYSQCLLQGRKIAVVGGLKRLERGYCEVVKRYGGECLFHNGEMKSGAQGLRRLVHKSDMVVCITSVNSHGAMNAVKKQCKRCRKRFCPLNGAGVGALENLLLEVSDEIQGGNENNDGRDGLCALCR